MIRLTLRQFRTEAAVGFGLLVLLAIVLAVTGPHLANVNDAFQRSCKAAGNCARTPNPVFGVDGSLQGFLPLIVNIVPALIGLFFGAPLIARELETGTFRLAWTQSVTRRRWLATKLGLVGVVCMAIGGLLTWMVDWWATPLDTVNKNRIDPTAFAWHGIAPIGYAAFAFVLGATAGVLLRRTIPAMAVMLAGFIVARLAVEHWIRPHFASPLHMSLPLGATGGMNLSARTDTVTLIPSSVTIPNDWVLSTSVLDKKGQALTSQDIVHACPGFGKLPSAPPSPGSFHACIQTLSKSFHTVVAYQPSSRFWLFQWDEMGIFLAAALVLCGLTYWRLRRQ